MIPAAAAALRAAKAASAASKAANKVKGAPQLAIGGYLGASKKHGSFMGFVTLMASASRNISIGIDRRARSERGGGDDFPTWRLFGILEFGNPNNKLFNVLPAPIPPRPAITRWARANRRNITRRLGTIAKKAAKMGAIGMFNMYIREAERIVRDIQAVIHKNSERPTAQMQTKKKGHSNPLYDTDTYSDAWRYFISGPIMDKNGRSKAVKADKALRRVKIGTNEGFSTVSGRGSFWSNLR
jgi:hypothetical protein